MRPSRPIPPAVLLLLLLAPRAQAVTLGDEVEAYLRVAAVSGREEPAAEFVASRLAGLPVTRDALGNVVVTLGSGSPRRLVACPMGEPGFVVGRIHEDGYLRLVPAGENLAPLWAQAHEGQTVVVGGAQGWRAGAVVLPSVHLMQSDADEPSETPFSVGDAWVDVGAESAAEVAAMGIRLLDPVALIRRPSRLAGDLLAGPSARLRGACIAAVDAARRLHPFQGKGTLVFAWTALDGINGKGLEHVVRRLGPFEEAILLSPRFGWKPGENDSPHIPVDLPAPGSGILQAGDGAAQPAPHVPMDDDAFPFQGGKTRVRYLGLPARYLETPVETIATADVARLADRLAEDQGGRKAPASTALPPLLPEPALVEATGHDETAQLLSTLVSRYGVSGDEGPVRDEILRQLPAWAKPEVDSTGNVLVTVGSGDEHVLFVAHMDEVGFRVAEVLADGRLRLETRGGLLPSVWEAQAALVHGGRGPVPAVFEPREGWRAAEKRWNGGGTLTAWLGVSSAKEAEALGVKVGSTVTMPKRMFRIGPHRVLARGLDDRNGCAALLLALRRIDPAKLGRRVTFAWVTDEETGLVGSTALAKRLTDLDRVHPVDTFVSSDSPIETKRFAYTVLGKGAVLRAMDNLSLTPRPLIDRFLALAERNGIPVQYGMTGGASDGVAFLANGPEMLPFSWPGRYSHSPIEAADLRDIESLIRLVVAAAGN